MIAARRGDDAAYLAAFLAHVHVDEPAADLEGADGGVVFMLDPDFAAYFLGKQWPCVLGGRRHRGIDDAFSGFDVSEGKHSRSYRTRRAPVNAGTGLIWASRAMTPRNAAMGER